MKAILGVGAVLLWFGFGLLQMGIGWAGAEHHLGFWWGVGLMAATLLFRFTLPMTVAVFFGARDVLGWHWLGALAFALPGLLFMVPGLGLAAIEACRGRHWRRSS